MREFCLSLDSARQVSNLPPMSLPTLDRVLRRADSFASGWRTPRLRLPWLHLGDRAEQVRVAGVAILLAAFALFPTPYAELPGKIVHVPGSGWVDAGTIPGLPPSARDGDRLAFSVVGASVVPAVADVAEVEAAEPAHAFALGRTVSLNQAAVPELEGLPGVGPKLAARIVAGRPFRSVRDLDRVRGIGGATLSRLTPLVEP